MSETTSTTIEHQPGSRPRSTSRLTELPVEILLSVTDNLGVNDVTSLTLSNLAMQHKLGTKSWPQLHKGLPTKVGPSSWTRGLAPARRSLTKARAHFLHSLSRDRPGSYHCHICSNLHTIASLPPRFRPAYRNKRPCENPAHPDVSLQCFKDRLGQPGYHFAYKHVQLAMARHRYGQGHGIALESLASTRVQIYPCLDIHTLLSIEPQVILDRLCLRVQHWVTLSRGQFRNSATNRGLVSICPHVDDGFVNDIVDHCLDLRNWKAARTSPIALRCDLCDVHWQIQSHHLCNCTISIALTEWLDLGSGGALPDHEWQRHTRARCCINRRRDCPHPVRPAIGARDAFEANTAKPLDTLTSENKARLVDARATRHHEVQAQCLARGTEWKSLGISKLCPSTPCCAVQDMSTVARARPASGAR